MFLIDFRFPRRGLYQPETQGPPSTTSATFQDAASRNDSVVVALKVFGSFRVVEHRLSSRIIELTIERKGEENRCREV